MCIFLPLPCASLLSQDLRFFAAAAAAGAWAILHRLEKAAAKDLMRRGLLVCTTLILLNGWWIYAIIIQIRSAWEQHATSFSTLSQTSRLSGILHALQPELAARGQDFHLGLYDRLATNPIFLFTLLLPLLMIFILPLFRRMPERRRALSILLSLLVFSAILLRAAGHAKDFHLLLNPLGTLSFFSEGVGMLAMIVWMPVTVFFAMGAESLYGAAGHVSWTRRFPVFPQAVFGVILLSLGLQIHPLVISPLMLQGSAPLRYTSTGLGGGEKVAGYSPVGGGVFELPDHDSSFVITQDDTLARIRRHGWGEALKIPSSSLIVDPCGAA